MPRNRIFVTQGMKLNAWIGIEFSDRSSVYTTIDFQGTENEIPPHFNLMIPTEAEEIAALIRAWKNADKDGLDIMDCAMLPEYQSIIGKGTAALPLIFASLQHDPDHWFWALHHITGQNPVAAEHEGDLDGMTADWIRWGIRNGHIFNDRLDQ